MAQRHDELTDAGARVVGISVDDPQRNAAMVERFQLPFPLLSDLDGTKAIKPYGVWHEGNDYARPAVVVVSPDGQPVFRKVGTEFSDRLDEDELLDRLRTVDREGELDLSSVEQSPPQTLQPEPSDGAFPPSALVPYFKGVRFAAIALGLRAPQAKNEADTLAAQAERYVEAAQTLQA